MNSFLREIFLTGAAIAVMTSSVYAQPEVLSLNKNTSHYMNLGQRITRIAVGSAEVATAVQLPGSLNEFLIVTKGNSGTTSLFVWTADGERHEYVVTVSAEDPGQALTIEQAIGLPDVHVRMVDNRILLTGTVENQYEKNYALQTVRLFVGKASDSSLLVGSGFDMKLETSAANDVGRSDDLEVSKSESKGEIIDLLQIRNPTQIRLEAQIIEINSEDAKALGLQYGTSGSGGIFSFGEDYTRDSHTTITETNSDNWARNYSGDWTDSYSGDSSNGYSGTRYSYTGDTNNYYTNSYNNGWSNDYTNGRNGGNDWSGGKSFNRTVSVSYGDLIGFANNPLKWIGQHFAPVNMTLTALTTKGKAKILSRPSVMTLSGEQATIQIGGKIPYTATNANGSSNVIFENYGIILQFKPVVDENNKINSIIHAEVSNLSSQSVNGQPIITTRSADSVINVHSGGAIVIGGLMDSSETKNVTKIPLLGDIPILGEFFKHTSKSRDKRELIILVTPKIIGAEEAGETYWSPTMREWYGLDQKYREAMERVNFNSPKPDEPPARVDEPFSDK
ncbi:MAG: pilus assembly protein N-terminal domain-containing protein [Selenomonadaceae bacterium]|nr:pilus assembly protein N-terminal domain-containing protein [Selenomonadaceae bacterium]